MMNKHLFKSGLDVVLQSGFVARVRIDTTGTGRKESDDDEATTATTSTTTTIYCCAQATAGTIKSLLRERLPDKVQGATTAVELQLRDKDDKHIFGRFDKAPPSSDTLLQCHVRPIEPTMQVLFQLVGLGKESERDRMREKMMTPRPPKQCPGGHDLVEADSDEDMEGMVCDNCKEALIMGDANFFGCRACNYDLCAACYQNDPGSDTIMIMGTDEQCPYAEVEMVAKHLGKKYAQLACGPSLSRVGREVGTIYWDNTNWGWVIPSSFIPFFIATPFQSFPATYIARVPWHRPVVGRGVRLVIRLSNQLRAVVVEAVIDSQPRSPKKRRTSGTGSNNSIDDSPTLLLPGEVDEILQESATMEDLKLRGTKLLEHSTAWSNVKERLEQRVNDSEWNGDRNSIYHDVKLWLDSFECDKVTYRLFAVALIGRPHPITTIAHM